MQQVSEEYVNKFSNISVLAGYVCITYVSLYNAGGRIKPEILWQPLLQDVLD